MNRIQVAKLGRQWLDGLGLFVVLIIAIVGHGAFVGLFVMLGVIFFRADDHFPAIFALSAIFWIPMAIGELRRYIRETDARAAEFERTRSPTH